MKKEIVTGAIVVGKTLIHEFSKSKALQRTLLGSYSDGEPRSVVDALTGETMSPKSKHNMELRIKENAKKKKKKKKKGQKYAKINLD